MIEDRPISTPHGGDDEVAIRELLDRQVAGWDAGDPDVYASVFTGDADYVNFLGSCIKGRAASYVPMFKKLLKGSRLDTAITHLRFLTPDVALIQVEAGVARGAGRRARRNRVNTNVAVRTAAEGWLLAASQNTTRRPLTDKLIGKLTSLRSHSR